MSEVELIMRRKARRIERANNRLQYLKSDIKESDNIPDNEKNYLLNQISDMEKLLQNDDKEENNYNYGNNK